MEKATIVFTLRWWRCRCDPARRISDQKSAAVVVGVVFGYFTTFFQLPVSFLPTPDNLAVPPCHDAGQHSADACGIFFYLPADIIPLAGGDEGDFRYHERPFLKGGSRVWCHDGCPVSLTGLSDHPENSVPLVSRNSDAADSCRRSARCVEQNLFGEKRDLLLAETARNNRWAVMKITTFFLRLYSTSVGNRKNKNA